MIVSIAIWRFAFLQLIFEIIHLSTYSRYLKQARAAECRRPGLALTAAALLRKSRFKCIDVKVPQQTNSCDCGVFLLHFAEKFIQRGVRLVNVRRMLPSFNILFTSCCQPHKPNWFPVDEIEKKRHHIRVLLCRLAIGANKQEEWGTEDEGSETDQSRTEEEKEEMELVDEKFASKSETSLRNLLCNASSFRSICDSVDEMKAEEMTPSRLEVEFASAMEQSKPLNETDSAMLRPVAQPSNGMSILDESPMQLLESWQSLNQHKNEHKPNAIGTPSLQFVAATEAKPAALTASLMSVTGIPRGHLPIPKPTQDPDVLAGNNKDCNSEAESVVDLTA